MITDKNEICIDLLEIKDVIDIEMLQNFQDSFAESMDIASITVDRYGIPVTKPSCYADFCSKFIHSNEIGDERCAKCHKKAGEESVKLGKPYIYKCHAGLIDFAAPIIVEGKQIGTILGGQVLTEKPCREKYDELSKELKVDADKFINSLNKVKVTTEENIRSAADVLFITANALSKIGYEELKLKKIYKNLENEILEKNVLLEEANKYNELKTKFFSTISHELKTPLNILFSSVQLLEEYYKHNVLVPDNKMFYKYSGIMKQNCYRLIRLIDNIVDMNKIELGFFELNLKNENIVKVIEDITLSIVDFANRKNITIIFDTDVEEKITACDSEKLERVMLNLLSNAIKFTDAGGNIYVNMYDKGDFVLISVKDTGIGIPENMHDKIFDTFTQVDSSLTRNFEGSGIGLSLAKSIVELHKGTISIKSQLASGSEFIIKLPVKPLDEDKSSKNKKVYKEDDIINHNVERINIQFSDIYL